MLKLFRKIRQQLISSAKDFDAAEKMRDDSVFQQSNTSSQAKSKQVNVITSYSIHYTKLYEMRNGKPLCTVFAPQNIGGFDGFRAKSLYMFFIVFVSTWLVFTS